MSARRAPRSSGVAIVISCAIALVALLAYGLTATGASTTIADAVSRGERPAAPSRVLPKLGGGAGSLADLRGRPVLVNFWASWCEPCKEEAPLLVRAHRRLAAAGGTVLGITVKDATPDSQRFVKQFRLPFPNLRDVDDKLGDEYGVTGVPETYAVDREGRIVAVSKGQIDDRWVDGAVRRIASR